MADDTLTLEQIWGPRFQEKIDANAAMRSAAWAATYGAYFSAQVHARIAAGEGPPPDDETWDRFAEEAETVADEAAGRVTLPYAPIIEVDDD